MISITIALLGLLGADPVKPVRDSRLLVAIDRLRPLRVDSTDVAVVEEGLAGALQRTGRVRVLERSQINRVMEEQGFQRSGACDGSTCAVEVGKILGVDRLVLGSLGRVGKTYALNLRMVDVATGEMLSSPTRSTEQIDQLLNALPGIAADLIAPPAPPGAAAPTVAPQPQVRTGLANGKPWIGLRYESPESIPGLQALHTLQGIPDTGVVVTKVEKNSPSALAGLRPDDLLVSCNGKIILGMNPFQTQLRSIEAGDNLELVYIRSGERRTTNLVVATPPPR